MIKGQKKTVSVPMSLDLYERLKARSNDTGRSLSAYIRLVLKDYLWHLENHLEMVADRRTVRGNGGQD